MSELQLISISDSGAKLVKRVSLMSDRYFCMTCNEWHIGLGVEDPHYTGKEIVEYYDDLPPERLYPGVNGCKHAHDMPNVGANNCAYCKGTE